MPSCRSSGLLTGNTQVINGQCKLISIHVHNAAGAPSTVKVFDGTDNTGKELARITLDGGQQTQVEFDMHGVLCSNGIYYEETSGNSEVFIHFA